MTYKIGVEDATQMSKMAADLEVLEADKQTVDSIFFIDSYCEFDMIFLFNLYVFY